MSTNISSEFHSPYDDIIPDVDDINANFYIDFVRIYLALCANTTSLEEAIIATEELKKHPEYTKNPMNPTLLPRNEIIMNKIISNLNTLRKYNLNSVDSLRSACTFAILSEESPLSKTDTQVLVYFIQNPLATYQRASEELEISPQTVSNSFQRLKQRHRTRFTSIMDTTAFGSQRVIVFFTLTDGIEWMNVEQGLASYPYTKSILKTVTADLGYTTFIIPGYPKSLPIFINSIQSLKGSIFNYLSIHHEIWTGANSNFTLLKEQKWDFPSEITNIRDMQKTHRHPQAVIECQGLSKKFSIDDFVVASQLAIDVRTTPLNMHRNLLSKGWDIDTGRISKSIQRLLQYNIVKPYSFLGGVGLSTNMTVEIICDSQLIKDISSIFCLAPYSMFFASSRGVVLWLMVPSNQQVQYCQILELLEEQKGVEQIWPIMTISLRGSRSILDLFRNCEFKEKGWQGPKEELDISQYILSNLD